MTKRVHRTCTFCVYSTCTYYDRSTCIYYDQHRTCIYQPHRTCVRRDPNARSTFPIGKFIVNATIIEPRILTHTYIHICACTFEFCVCVCACARIGAVETKLTLEHFKSLTNLALATVSISVERIGLHSSTIRWSGNIVKVLQLRVNMYRRLKTCGEHVSYSKDSILGDLPCSEDYTPEFLHTLTPTGMPPHELCLRPGTLVILLRNYAPTKGMCNGTRAVVAKAQSTLLTLRIVTGPFRGNVEVVPRICCDSSGNSDLPFVLRRLQFPVRYAWAITINKSQGQTIPARLGIYLPTPVFSHGQLYVALSRATSFAAVRVLARDHEDKQRAPRDSAERSCVKTLNIVDRALLASAKTHAEQIPDTAVKSMWKLSISLM